MKKLNLKFVVTGLLAGMIAVATGCSSAPEETAETEQKAAIEEPENTDPMSNKGIGPITELKLEAVDAALAKKGEDLFVGKCSACHALDKRVVGPALGKITEIRTPEWIMNMILNPEEMVQKDPIAKELLAEYIAPMANQSLTEDEARAILEYFRKSDQ